MSSNWYLVDTKGETQGPVNEEELIQLYLQEVIHSKTYIWNGETVLEWVPIMTVPEIYNKIKARYMQRTTTSRPTPPRATPPRTTKTRFTPQRQERPKRLQPQNSHIYREEEKTDSNPQSRAAETTPQPIVRKPIIRHQPRESAISKFLPGPGPKLGADHAALLMANIKHGVKLRSCQDTEKYQQEHKMPPNRLKDPFEEKLPAEFKQEIKQVEQIRRNNMNALRSSRATNQSQREQGAMSNELNHDIQRMMDDVRGGGYNNDRKEYNRRATKPLPHPGFDDEMALKVSGVRKKFGNVKVTSSHSHANKRRRNSTQQSTQDDANGPRQQRPHTFDGRIEELKDKLYQLTDRESWIITRIENVFKNVNK